jgi:hypothetical protein
LPALDFPLDNGSTGVEVRGIRFIRFTEAEQALTNY